MKIRIVVGVVLVLTVALVLKLQSPLRAQDPRDPLASPPPAAPAVPEPPPVVLDGITFAAHRDVVYLPVREVAKLLNWPLRWNPRSRAAALNGQPVSRRQSRWLLDRTLMVALPSLNERGVDVSWDPDRQAARLVTDGKVYLVRAAPKRVAVNRSRQQLRAWQGNRVVLATSVSTGKPGDETPRGHFTAGPLKTPMLISHKYNDAEMPWSVQVRGSVMIHGSKSVPRHAASHGCVRVPLSGQNPAKWIYDWIDLGTPITIADGWPKGSEATLVARRNPRGRNAPRSVVRENGRAVDAPQAEEPVDMPLAPRENAGARDAR